MVQQVLEAVEPAAASEAAPVAFAEAAVPVAAAAAFAGVAVGAAGAAAAYFVFDSVCLAAYWVPAAAACYP